jgi:hypothetical protein
VSTRKIATSQVPPPKSNTISLLSSRNSGVADAGARKVRSRNAA